jgi:alginate O-acetyltransferase complex protein AlgJ
VLALHRALGVRGIRLVLFPVPDKATLQPAQLHGRQAEGAPAGNRDLERFIGEMRAAGVLVFDAAPLTLAKGERPRFLVQDTHWTPAFMQATAEALGAFLRANVSLPVVTPPSWKTAPLSVSRVGDIVDMLKLPEGQTLFAPQTVSLRQVLEADGQPWQPKESADVLLLGDSFTNVFSLSTMGWGESAGLGPQLALALGRDVDVIAQNDSGAFATRKLLSEALGAGEDRLAGKRVVIWEFASRELAVGSWKPFPFALGKKP